MHKRVVNVATKAMTVVVWLPNELAGESRGRAYTAHLPVSSAVVELESATFFESVLSGAESGSCVAQRFEGLHERLLMVLSKYTYRWARSASRLSKKWFFEMQKNEEKATAHRLAIIQCSEPVILARHDEDTLPCVRVCKHWSYGRSRWTRCWESETRSLLSDSRGSTLVYKDLAGLWITHVCFLSEMPLPDATVEVQINEHLQDQFSLVRSFDFQKT
ncbi:hypothetical protein DFH11DRAFT_1546776 [Phellopilus nigrolimitatus]|nr:hypothetical protein DFH11DRAFT_1546776 [Phellopilus nigrolimitatus]